MINDEVVRSLEALGYVRDPLYYDRFKSRTKWVFRHDTGRDLSLVHWTHREFIDVYTFPDGWGIVAKTKLPLSADGLRAIKEYRDTGKYRQDLP